MSDDVKGPFIVISPEGEAVFPWLNQPDTRFDPDGVFQTKLAVPFEEAQDFIAQLEKIRDDFKATLDPKKVAKSTIHPVYEDELDDEGKPTGRVEFKFKLKYKVTPRDKEPFYQEVKIVDAEYGEKIEERVYGGSRIKIKGQAVPYHNAATGLIGVTLRPRGVKVYELVTGGGNWTDMDDD